MDYRCDYLSTAKANFKSYQNNEKLQNSKLVLIRDLCTSLETVLKAYLNAIHGLSAEELKKKDFSHNLESLYSDCCLADPEFETRFNIPDEVKVMICKIDKYYMSHKLDYFPLTSDIRTHKILLGITNTHKLAEFISGFIDAISNEIQIGRIVDSLPTYREP